MPDKINGLLDGGFKVHGGIGRRLFVSSPPRPSAPVRLSWQFWLIFGKEMTYRDERYNQQRHGQKCSDWSP